MRRRAFIAGLGGAAAWLIAARAQQSAKPPTIGFLGSGTLTAQGLWLAAFLQRLHELGWIEGRNLVIEYRWAEGSSDRAAQFAAEFVQLKVDVIVTYANPMVLAAKHATSVIPIIFAAAADPLGTGLVASLARPGGNVTGLSIQHTELASKRAELLREVVPGLRRLAIMVIAVIPPPCWIWAKSRQQHAHSASRPPHWKSGERRTLRPHSSRSRGAPKDCTFVSTRSYSPIGFASTPWRSLRGYRRYSAIESTSKREV